MAVFNDLPTELRLQIFQCAVKNAEARAKWVLAIKNSYRVMVGGFDTNPPTQEEIRKEALGGLSVCKERQEEVKEFVKKELA